MSAVMKHAEIKQTSKVAKNQYKFPVLDCHKYATSEKLINDSFYNITL